TLPTRADRWSASCALSTTTRTARRSTTGGALPGAAATQRPSPRAREDPSSTTAPAHDPARRKSRRVQVPSRSMAILPPPESLFTSHRWHLTPAPVGKVAAVNRGARGAGAPGEDRSRCGNADDDEESKWADSESELTSWGGRTRTSNFQSRDADALSVAPNRTRT